MYYLHPLADQIKQVQAAGIEAHVWTWPQTRRAVEAAVGPECVRTIDLDRLSRDVWRKERWEHRLSEVTSRPGKIEGESVDLLDARMAKLPLVQRSLQETGASIGFWVDSGLPCGYYCRNRYEAYASEMVERWYLATGLPILADLVRKHGILLCGAKQTNTNPATVTRGHRLTSALFGLRADYADEAIAHVQSSLNKLLKSGRISSGEPEMALAAAENDWPSWTFDHWDSVLHGVADEDMVRKPFVAIMGLHSSGSSCIAGMVHHLGGYIGRHFVGRYGHDPNSKGCGFEAKALAEACWRMLPSFPAVDWIQDSAERRAALHGWIRSAVMEANRRGTIAGGKHPTLCALGDELLDICGDNLKVIVCDRPIAESVASIVRLGGDPTTTERHQQWLWDARQRLVGQLPPDRVLDVNYASVLADSLHEAHRIADFLGLELKPEKAEKINWWVQPEKRHVEL